MPCAVRMSVSVLEPSSLDMTLFRRLGVLLRPLLLSVLFRRWGLALYDVVGWAALPPSALNPSLL